MRNSNSTEANWKSERWWKIKETKLPRHFWCCIAIVCQRSALSENKKRKCEGRVIGSVNYRLLWIQVEKEEKITLLSFSFEEMKPQVSGTFNSIFCFFFFARQFSWRKKSVWWLLLQGVRFSSTSSFRFVFTMYPPLNDFLLRNIFMTRCVGTLVHHHPQSYCLVTMLICVRCASPCPVPGETTTTRKRQTYKNISWIFIK